MLVAIICFFVIILLITLSVISFGILNNITSSAVYSGNNDAKTAHWLFLSSFILIACLIIVLVFSTCVVGYNKIFKHTSKSKLNFNQIKNLVKDLSSRKFLTQEQQNELKSDEKIIKDQSKSDFITGLVLGIICIFVIIAFVLDIVGLYYLSNAYSSSTTSSGGDPQLGKAKNYAYVAIADSVLIILLILFPVFIEGKDFIDNQKILKDANKKIKNKNIPQMEKDTKTEELNKDKKSKSSSQNKKEKKNKTSKDTSKEQSKSKKDKKEKSSKSQESTKKTDKKNKEKEKNPELLSVNMASLV